MLDLRGELRADFQQFYGLDSEELLNAGDFERLATLVKHLPNEARVVRAIDPRAEWDTSAYLLALIADHLAFSRYEQAGCKGKKPKQLERPKARPKTAHKSLDISKEKRHELLFGKRKRVGGKQWQM